MTGAAPRLAPRKAVGFVLARPALLCFAVLLLRAPGWAAAGAFLLAAALAWHVEALCGEAGWFGGMLGFRRFLTRTYASWLRPADRASLGWFVRAMEAGAVPQGPVGTYVVHDAGYRPWTRERAFQVRDGTSLLFFRADPARDDAGAYARYALLHALGYASARNPFRPGRLLESRTTVLAGIVLAWSAGFHWVTLGILGLYWIVLVLCYLGPGHVQARMQADRLAFQCLDPEDLARLPRLLAIRARHDGGRVRRDKRRLLAARLIAARRAVRTVRAGEPLPDWRVASYRPTPAVFCLAAALSVVFAPAPRDPPLVIPLLAVLGIILVRYRVRSLTALFERINYREVGRRLELPVQPPPRRVEGRKSAMEPFRITAGMVARNVLARPLSFCCAVLFLRDPGLGTAVCFVLDHLAYANTAHFGGTFQSLLNALRLHGFLRSTGGARLVEVDVEALNHFRRIAHVAHFQWPAWRQSRDRRWDDYALPFKPIRAYVIQDPENRAWTREKTFHTHESTSYLFFRSPPRDEGGSPFNRYALLHELGHAAPLNIFTPGRKLEFTAGPGVALLFAWVAGFGPVVLAILAVYWALILLHYASEGVRLAHELTADAFAYQALDERDLRILPRLLKVKARHDRALQDRAQRRLALARLMVVRQAVRALETGEPIPPRFLPPRRPDGVLFSLAAGAAILFSQAPVDLPLVWLTALTLVIVLATLPMEWLTHRFDERNVAEIAARTVEAADPQPVLEVPQPAAAAPALA